MNILITGGAGYIGSHIIKQLGEQTSHNITIIDNLSTGFEKNILYGKLIKEDLKNTDKIEEIFKKNNFDVIIHFSASIVVSESVQDPLKYYMNNTINTTNLINLAIKYKIKKFIFSSTAAVYNSSNSGVMKETDTLSPLSPYGWSKLMSERVLIDSVKSNNANDDDDNCKYVILRYFNVAGASIDGKIGQCFPNATHLIHIASEVVAKKREKMFIFGDDYDTKDGTCIRDYVHIEDLASAHLMAIDYDKSDIFNCGYKKGYSVKEIIDTVKKVSNDDFEVAIKQRRYGDAATLISDNAKILKLTKWKPKYNNLEIICETAIKWEQRD